MSDNDFNVILFLAVLERLKLASLGSPPECLLTSRLLFEESVLFFEQLVVDVESLGRNGRNGICKVPEDNGEPCNQELECKKSTISLSYHLTNVHNLEKGTPAHSKLAKAALRFWSISPTEAAVEHAYSHLKYVHSALRNRLSDPTQGSI